MQTVWSRVAQTRGTCNCPQCLQTVHAVSRRATASATRKIPKFLYSSTLFYSGVFAAAATWDAAGKERRREQWDRAIAEVKQELSQVADTTDRGATSAVPSKSASRQTSDNVSGVPWTKGRPRWPTNTGPDLMIHRLPPESIYATDERKARADLRRWTPKKLENVMLSVDMLQLKIFLELQTRFSGEAWAEDALTCVPAAYREVMSLPPANLRAVLERKMQDTAVLANADSQLSEWSRSPTDNALCTYQQDDAGDYHHVARELNNSLQNLFRQHKAGVLSTPSLLAKLAYNLSISTAPPNVNIYNTLLDGLSGPEHPRLMRAVIKSLRETHLRPNENTNVAILEHYTTINDVRGFARWVERMRGKHKGLSLARPDIHINPAGEIRLVRVEREGKPDKVIQLPYPTPDVFGALIKGVLKLSGFDTALAICSGMGQEGWGLCMAGLTPLLIDCADRSDWNAGMAVWHQIQALRARGRKRTDCRYWAAQEVNPNAFAAMLRLCMRSGDKNTYKTIWQQAMRTNLQAPQLLVDLVKAQNATADEALARQSNVAATPVSQRPKDGSTQTTRADTDHTNSHPVERLVRQHLDDEHNVVGMTPPSARRSRSRYIIQREQLEGSLPASDELDDYEIGERPMAFSNG
ncbi:hypothetical protein BAUCODRAFT_27901 [Baudoinia panamericana UAMH 10762]|uniref:Uncharacterized protein n=1 Tax=Baudoinia panamericana (strain UAMH 10762) TaxID=717646 RepID=M2M4T6_BAUPA|nr:uncharacterized protein BAUCODRAFT_27901 [Baudoinia panamericana UAMH 10762]EMC91616.1 hypothetical protein BAUCODRAFT_27901 [Baudoinia panamericana UAMH 10762]